MTRRAGRPKFTKSRQYSVMHIYHSPYEVLAVAAEGGLLEEPWHEAVILDHVDILLLESALPAPQLVGKIGVAIAGPGGVLARVVLRIVRHGAAAADAATRCRTTDRQSIDVDGCPELHASGSSPGTPASPESGSESASLTSLGTWLPARAIPLSRNAERCR